MIDVHMPTAEQGVVATGIVLVVAAIYVLIRAQGSKAHPLDFATLLLDQDKASLRKVGELIALLTTTWVVLYMAVKGDLSDTIFFAYIGAWVSRTVLGVLAGAKASAMASANPPQPAESSLPPSIRRPGQ